jgi:hypothetical protein
MVASGAREGYERNKVDDTPIIPMNQIYYNFIRPHQALKGLTPGEMAGIGINGNNKWRMLLELATHSSEWRSINKINIGPSYEEAIYVDIGQSNSL